MDKLLSDIEKDNIAKNGKDKKHPHSATGHRNQKFASKSVATTGYNPELTQEKYAAKQPWNAGPMGRAGIRIFSRGLMGAAFFAAGGWYVHGGATGGNGMKGYMDVMEGNHTPSFIGEASFKKIYKMHGFKKPLQYVAFAIDSTFGNIIKRTAMYFGANEEKADRILRFRPTSGKGIRKSNRTLGHESVVITFDFFSASIGDALGRDIADHIDPNNKKRIWKDENGKTGVGITIKNVGKTLWRYLTYNGGEDWAVAVPYAFYLRAQRNLIEKFSPGFKYDADRALNGASFKMDDHNKIVGNYNLEGMLDLQGRFTAYNVGTLMYRELYNHVADKMIHHRATSLYGTPDPHKKHTLLGDVGDVIKWGARSTIKGVMYMTPAVPFFTIFRTSQTKYKGAFINPEKGIMSYDHDVLHGHELTRGNYGKASKAIYTGQRVSYYKFNEETRSWGEASTAISPLASEELNGSIINKNFNPTAQATSLPGRTFDVLGQAQTDVRVGARNVLEKHYGNTFVKKWGRTADRYVNAAFAYTPYMYAKAETANWVDSGKMDMAIERMIDGATGLNFKEFAAGAKETWRATLHKPLADPVREKQAQHRRLLDTSPSDDLTKDQSVGIRSAAFAKGSNGTPWSQRIVQGQPLDVASMPRKDATTTYTDQEAMRKALEEAHPLTNSIH